MAAMIALTVATSSFAADVKGINSVAISSFKVEFKNATDVNWSTVGDLAKATFILDDVRMEAFYNTYGELIGTAKGLSLEALPVNAKRTFAKKYDGYTVKEVVRFEGVEERAFFIYAEKDKKSVILKVDDNSQISTFKKTSK